MLIEVSNEFNIPEIKLVHAIHDAPGILQRLNRKSEKYVAYIKSALLDHLKADNIVYHGLASHFFVKNVPHALKVRVLSDMEDRVRLEMERKNIDADKARRLLEKDDKERRNWSLDLYGIDTADPMLYDLIVDIKQITVDDAVEMICNCVSKEQFKTTPESQRMIQELALSAAVHNALIDVGPNITVCVDNHIAYIETEAAVSDEEKLVKEIRQAVAAFEEITDVKIKCHPIVALSE